MSSSIQCCFPYFESKLDYLRQTGGYYFRYPFKLYIVIFPLPRVRYHLTTWGTVENSTRIILIRVDCPFVVVLINGAEIDVNASKLPFVTVFDFVLCS